MTDFAARPQSVQTCLGANRISQRISPASPAPTGPLCFDRRPSARLADEERPVRRALVVLPPRHMTAALRHRQSRSARLRGQLRPSDDRLVSDRWARSLSGPSPACRSPVRLAARGPLACSPPPPRFPAPPRFPVHLTALELRSPQTARSGRQSSGRPGGRCSAPSESVRPRVLLPPPPPLHPVPVCRESCFVYVYVVCVWTYVTLEPLSSVYDSRPAGTRVWMVAGGRPSLFLFFSAQ